MKRYALVVALLLSIMTNSYAMFPTGAMMFDICVPSLRGGWNLGIEALDWGTASPHFDYALTYPHINDIDDTIFEEGRYHSVDPDSSWNFKYHLGYTFPCTGNDIILTYLNYHQRSSSHASIDPWIKTVFPSLSDEWPTFGSITLIHPALIPVTLFIPGISLSPSGLPLIPNPTEPTVAFSKGDIQHNAVDLDFGQYVNVGCRTRLHWYGGVRFATIKDKLDATYNFNTAVTGLVIPGVVADSNATINLGTNLTETVTQKSDYEGIGPHTGFDIGYYLGYGFGLIGNISSSLLVGEIDTLLDENLLRSTSALVTATTIPTILIGTNFENTVAESQNFKHPRENRIVPNIDAKLGIDFSYQFCKRYCNRVYHSRLTFELGYTVSHYFNAVDRVSEVAIDNPELQTRHTIAAHFEGLYFAFKFNV